jgi:hypothetical protein
MPKISPFYTGKFNSFHLPTNTWHGGEFAEIHGCYNRAQALEKINQWNKQQRDETGRPMWLYVLVD